MEVRYELRQEDVSDALRAVRAPQWVTFLFFLLLALLFLVGIYLIDHDFSVAGWIWLALSFAIGIATYEAPRIQAVRAIRRIPSLQGEIVLILNEEGTAATFPTGKSELEWRAYTKYRETANLFLLFVAPSRYTLIPKRVMSPKQINDLRMLLNARIPAKQSN